MSQQAFGVHLCVNEAHLDDAGHKWAQRWIDEGGYGPDGHFFHHVGNRHKGDPPKCWLDIFAEAGRRGLDRVLVEDAAPVIEGLPTYDGREDQE